jgi:hypothetical protein
MEELRELWVTVLVEDNQLAIDGTTTTDTVPIPTTTSSIPHPTTSFQTSTTTTTSTSFSPLCPTTSTILAPPCGPGAGVCFNGQDCVMIGIGTFECQGPERCGAAQHYCGGECPSGQTCEQRPVPAGCPATGCACQ